jgi:hypothetical protein
MADRSTGRREVRRGPPVVRLPRWFWLAFFDVRYWFVTIPAATILAIVAWFGDDWLGALRWPIFGAVVLLALPFPAVAVIFVIVFVVGKIRSAARRRTLDRDESVAGLELPAGSKIRFHDKAHVCVDSIDLPHVTDIRGMRLVGKLRRYDIWHDIGPVWRGTLAEDQCLDGLPCCARAPTWDEDGIVFDKDAVVQECTLAIRHELLGLNLPPGTTVRRGNDNRPWYFLLPSDLGVDIPALATTTPPGVTLFVANDGRLERIDSGHGQTIVVRGVPLNSMNFRLLGEQVVSELAEPLVLAGEMRPAGTRVRVDLPTGGVTVSGP